MRCDAPDTEVKSEENLLTWVSLIFSLEYSEQEEDTTKSTADPGPSTLAELTSGLLKSRWGEENVYSSLSRYRPATLILGALPLHTHASEHPQPRGSRKRHKNQRQFGPLQSNSPWKVGDKDTKQQKKINNWRANIRLLGCRVLWQYRGCDPGPWSIVCGTGLFRTLAYCLSWFLRRLNDKCPSLAECKHGWPHYDFSRWNPIEKLSINQWLPMMFI